MAGGANCNSSIPVVSPDAKDIVFETICPELAGLAAGEPQEGKMYVVRRTRAADGTFATSPIQIVSAANDGTPLNFGSRANFSPSGTMVTFVERIEHADGYDHHIRMKNLVNGKLTSITGPGFNPSSSDHPVFSPSGLDIVFEMNFDLDPNDSNKITDIYVAHLVPAAIGGADNLNAGGGDDLIVGGPKADVMAGGTGDDLIFVQDTGDKVVEAAKGGNDTVVASIDFKLPPNVENLTLVGKKSLAGVGNARANVIRGNAGGNVINAGGGADVVHGGLGDDTIRGGTGPDVLTGGAGADRFVYRKTKESGAKSVDTITDFSWKSGDRIDLSRFDASKRKKKRQAFVYVGSKRFSRKAGELRFADRKLQGDVDGDGKADFVVKLRGVKALPRKAILF